jgi:putative PIN family toxin of toxin-antitoxin system
MRIVVLDTNVIVSARVSRTGTPAKLLDNWILAGKVQTLTSPAIIREYREVTSRPKFTRYGFPPPWLDFLIDESLKLEDLPTWPHQLPDPDDLPFIVLAHRAGAWLVTGNLKHYPASARNGVAVISPADYLAHLTSSERPALK